MRKIKYGFFILLGLIAFGNSVSAQSNQVVIYSGVNFQGANTSLSESWTGGGAYWLNRIRSIRVDRAQILPPVRPLPPTPPVADSFPVIYAGTNLDGAAEAVERDKADLTDWDGSPHTIRSIRVPQGWFFVLYKQSNFRGKSYNVSSNITFAPGDEWYNRIRSIKVYKGTPPQQPRQFS